MFWGWGGEDDDMSNRLRIKKLYISRYPANIARYTFLLTVIFCQKQALSSMTYMIFNSLISCTNCIIFLLGIKCWNTATAPPIRIVLNIYTLEEKELWMTDITHSSINVLTLRWNVCIHGYSWIYHISKTSKNINLRRSKRKIYIVTVLLFWT